MKVHRSFLGAGLAALFVLLAAVETAWPQTMSPVPIPERDSGYGIFALLFAIGLMVVVGIGVKLYDTNRKREDEEVALQSRLSDALLGDPSLAGLPITPTVRVPFSRRAPAVITLTGVVPSPTRREAVLQVISRVATPIRSDFRIEDRLVVDPLMSRRAA